MSGHWRFLTCRNEGWHKDRLPRRWRWRWPRGRYRGARSLLSLGSCLYDLQGWPGVAALHRSRLHSILNLPDPQPRLGFSVVLLLSFGKSSSLGCLLRRIVQTQRCHHIQLGVFDLLACRPPHMLPWLYVFLGLIDLPVIFGRTRDSPFPPLLLRVWRAILNHPGFVSGSLQIMNDVHTILPTFDSPEVHVDGTTCKRTRILEEGHHVSLSPKDATGFKLL
mmetsp:Transcript_18152/g.31851  ORF Transcript_18152/g.31851 Transcript_18152/m.31851 type:complete len:221 (+) Transcript_18152:337-999(+)